MLINNVSSIARKLQDEFESVSSGVQHPGEKGTWREESLKRNMRDLLPAKYSIGNGTVVDSNNSQSKQQDFIIYDRFSSPEFLRSESHVILPVESVYAITEIKSTFSKNELEKAIENAVSVKVLEKSLFHPPGFIVKPSNFIYSSVFAYSCDTNIMTLKKHFDEMNMDIPFKQRISTICILDQGCIVNVQRDNLESISTQPSDKTVTILRELSVEHALYMYYLILQCHLSSNIVYPPNLIRYANYQHPFKSSPITLDNQTLESIGNVKIGDLVLSSSDVKRYRRIQPYIGKSFTVNDATKLGFTTTEDMQREVLWGIEWILHADQTIARNIEKEEADTPTK